MRATLTLGTLSLAGFFAPRKANEGMGGVFARPYKGRFEDVARAELPVLYRVAARLTRQSEDAEDLVSRCLLSAARGWESFDGRHARSWLIRILKNEFFNSRRSGRVAPVGLDEITEPADEGFWENVSDRALSEALMSELENLPEEYRLAVVLCDVEQMSYEEAASALEVPIGTVRSRLFRGRRILRARLAHWSEGEELTRV
jgi:RNA polymerase sigma-70 factor (ECF subfamily)